MILIILKVYGSEICVFMARLRGATSGLSLSADFTIFSKFRRTAHFDSCVMRIFNWFYTSVASQLVSELPSLCLSGIFAMSSAIVRDFHNCEIGTRSAFVLSPVFHHFIRGQLTSLNPGEL